MRVLFRSTEEIQVLGKFEGFDFIVGGFLSHDRSAGAMGSTFRAFAVGDVPGVPVTAHVENKNYVIYGQVGVNITEKLTLNFCGRYKNGRAAWRARVGQYVEISGVGG